jgi:hypothetical protein
VLDPLETPKCSSFNNVSNISEAARECDELSPDEEEDDLEVVPGRQYVNDSNRVFVDVNNSSHIDDDFSESLGLPRAEDIVDDSGSQMVIKEKYELSPSEVAE